MNFVTYENLLDLMPRLAAKISSGGGSSGGGGVTVDTLYEGNIRSLSTGGTLNLSADSSKYDEVVVACGDGSCTLFPSVLTSGALSYWHDSVSYKCTIGVTLNGTTATTDYVDIGSEMPSDAKLYIIGKKYRSGSSSEGGSSYMVLAATTSAQVTTGSTINLSDDYTNYDEIVVTVSNESVVIFPFLQSYAGLVHLENDASYKKVLGINFSGSTAQISFASFGSEFASSPFNIYIIGKKIDNSGGNGASGVNAVVDTLWSGLSYTVGDVLNLTHSYTDYDYVICYLGDGDVHESTIMSTKTQDTISLSRNFGTFQRWLGKFSGATLTANACDNLSSSFGLFKVEGIKFSGGSSDTTPYFTGANIIRDVIWEGETSSNNESFTLLKDYTDYDLVLGYASIKGTPNEVWGMSFINPSVQHGMQLGLSAASDAWSFNIGLYFLSNTQAQVYYNLNSDNKFCVSRIEGIKFVNTNVYSTEEQRIGTYIDGKPLYQKTYDGTIISTTNTEVLDTIDPQIYNIKGYDGFVGGFAIPVYIPSTHGTGFCNLCHASNTGNLLLQFDTSGWPRASAEYSITIKYTKTTD